MHKVAIVMAIIAAMAWGIFGALTAGVAPNGSKTEHIGVKMTLAGAALAIAAIVMVALWMP